MSIITTMSEIEKLLEEMRYYSAIDYHQDDNVALKARHWREKAISLLDQLEDKQ